MKKVLLTSVIGIALFVSPLMVFADNPSQGPYTSGSSDQFTSGASNQTNTSAGGSRTVVNPLGVNSICGLIKALLGAAIAIGIPIAVLFIVYAGLKFVLARGNGERLAEARTNFLYTVIGIAIFLGAWLLASVIANTVNAISGTNQVISCN